MSRLEEIEARVRAATPGPWGDSGSFYQKVDGPGVDGVIAHDVLRDGDRAFIAAARADTPWLLAEVRRLQELVEFWQDEAR